MNTELFSPASREERRYKKLLEKYPDVEVKEDEDLNIERMIVKTLTKCFQEKSMTRLETSIATGMPEKTIYNYIKKYKLSSKELRDRRKIKEEQKKKGMYF